MRPEEMTLVRPVVEDFAADVFGGFARRDQRAKHRQLQQFVTTSTWDHVEVRRRLALWARDFVDPEGELDELDYGGRSVTAAFDTSRLRHQPPSTPATTTWPRAVRIMIYCQSADGRKSRSAHGGI